MRRVNGFSMTPTNNAPQSNGRHQYFNRELSWLAFNRRVLDQAFSEKYPLLERIRFLSFVSSNLDEFYEIRVAGLLQQVDAASTEADFDGIGPRELLERIRATCAEMVDEQYRCWKESLQPELERSRIHFKTVEELTPKEFKWLEKNWFADPSYLKLKGKPVLLIFGPQHFKKSQWNQITSNLATQPLLYTLPHLTGQSNSAGAFGWPPVYGGKNIPPKAWQNYLQNLYARGKNQYSVGGVGKDATSRFV